MSKSELINMAIVLSVWFALFFTIFICQKWLRLQRILRWMKNIFIKILDAAGWYALFFICFTIIWCSIAGYTLRNKNVFYDHVIHLNDSSQITSIISLITGLTNIFIFGVFQTKVTRDGDYRVVYYTIAPFKNVERFNPVASKSRISSNHISQYKLLSIYTHVSMLLIHLSFAISTFFVKDVVFVSLYLLISISLMIRFIYTFSKTFVVRSERMKNINTQVHIKMFERFIDNTSSKKDLENVWMEYIFSLDSEIKSDKITNRNFWEVYVNRENKSKSTFFKKDSPVDWEEKRYFLSKILDDNVMVEYLTALRNERKAKMISKETQKIGDLEKILNRIYNIEGSVAETIGKTSEFAISDIKQMGETWKN